MLHTAKLQNTFEILLVFLALNFQNTLLNLLFYKLGLNKLERVFTACYFVLDTFANADEKLGEERRGENRARGATASEAARRPLTAALRLQVAFPSQKKIGFIKN